MGQADADALEVMAHRLLRLAASAEAEADLLTNATVPGWRGGAADDFRAASRQTPAGLRRAADAWGTAGAVVREFASHLRQLQADARRAMRLLQLADELSTAWQAASGASGRDDPGADSARSVPSRRPTV